MWASVCVCGGGVCRCGCLPVCVGEGLCVCVYACMGIIYSVFILPP